MHRIGGKRMPRVRKAYNRVSVSLDEEIYDKIYTLCQKYPLTLSGLVNDIMKRNLDRYIDTVETAFATLDSHQGEFAQPEV